MKCRYEIVNVTELQLMQTKKWLSLQHIFYLCVLVPLLLAGCGGSAVDLSGDDQAPDPVVEDIPIAFIQRDLSLSDGEPLRSIDDPAEFIPGASLFIKQRANASAQPIDLTARFFPDALDQDGLPLPIDIKDLKADYSGSRIIVSVRAPELENAEEIPTWNIWEYDFDSDQLRRVIAPDAIARSGQDTGPVYLADGRIVFSSTRQRGNQTRLLDEGKPQYSGLEEGRDVLASVLHVMDADGSNIEQISYNQSHDLDPVVLPNGKILFSRWDQAGGNKGINLYQINPDGSGLTLMYGRHSHSSIEGLDDVQFVKANVNPDGDVFLGINSFSQPLFGTDFVTININDYIDNTTPLASLLGLDGTAQQSALFAGIELSDDISPQGYITAFYPLWDGSGRILYSWSQCRLYAPLADGETDQSSRTIAPCSQENIDAQYDIAEPVYGLWMYDPQQDTQLALSVPQEGVAVSEVVAVESRAFPANPESAIDTSLTSLIAAQLGTLHIASVYDIDGEDSSPFGLLATADPSQTSATQRSARFLRVVKSVSIPDQDVFDFDNSAFGRSNNQLMREIVGYTPIQPDGSVEVAVPAGIPFAISIVDANGQRISTRHNNWLQVMPGEQMQCIGCHANNSEAPHGRIDAQPASINLGAASSGPFAGANPALSAQLNETMAQTLSRVNGIAQLTGDIEYDDLWSDPVTTPVSPSFSFQYVELETQAPISQACAITWEATCRAVINYVTHISPMFTLTRTTTHADTGEIIQYACTSCHANRDEEGAIQVPAGQLELTIDDAVDRPDFQTSYRELLFNDNEQELVDGALLETLIEVVDENGNTVYEVDENGELILDAEGQPIAVTTTINVSAVMSVNGAASSNAFFSLFAAGGSHSGYLNDAELRLIREWLDIGGQYYNNPFDAPED